MRNLRAHISELHARASVDLSDASIRFELGVIAKQLEMTELAISWFSACLSPDRNHAEAAKELEALIRPNE